MHGYRDEEIVALLWARDEKALEAFSAQYRTLCLRMAENMLGERESAEECLNDLYLRLWQSIPPERPRSLKAYALRKMPPLSPPRWRTIICICSESIPQNKIEATAMRWPQFCPYNLSFPLAKRVGTRYNRFDTYSKKRRFPP